MKCPKCDSELVQCKNIYKKLVAFYECKVCGELYYGERLKKILESEEQSVQGS